MAGSGLCHLLPSLDLKIAGTFPAKAVGQVEVLLGASLIWGESGWPRLSPMHLEELVAANAHTIPTPHPSLNHPAAPEQFIVNKPVGLNTLP